MKILKRAFPDWKCPFCEWTLTYQVHHVNGKKDNRLDSLIMLCPNHHSAVHSGHLCVEDLKKYTVSKYYSLENILDKFYYGSNSSINFKDYAKGNEKCKKSIKERSKSVIK